MNKLLLAAMVLMASGAQAGEVIRLKATGAMKPSMLVSMMSEEASDLWLVQWKNAVHENEKSEVTKLGATILSYVPDDSFLVKMDRDAAARVATLRFVNVVVPFGAGLKIDPELTQQGIFSFGNFETVSVRALDTVTEADLASFFTNVKKIDTDLFVGQTELGKLWSLAARGDVLWIERYIPVKSMELSRAELLGDEAAAPSEAPAAGTYTGYESGTKIMKADHAWGLGFTGAGQIAAFADTGLDKGDINNIIPDFQGQVKAGYAMGLGGKSWGDPQNHGTHVAGSIAGSGKSSAGNIKGAAFQARLVAEGLWSEILNNISIPSITGLFQKAQQEGAFIHSNSWGAPNSNGRYDNFTVQADTYVFNNPDFLPVFAAGNDGVDGNKNGVIDEGSVSSPGSAKNVLTVGASKNYLLQGGIQRKLAELRGGKDKWGVEPLGSSLLSEDERGMAMFSSRGPAADGRIKPEVVAPGTNIVSARNTHPKADPNASWGVYNDSYLFMGGTSMATPLVSGAMTVIRGYLQQKLGGAAPSAALMKAAVSNTAFDLFPGQFGERAQGQEQPTVRPNNHQGWGRVALDRVVGVDSVMYFDDRTGVRTGEGKILSVPAVAGRPLAVTLAWSDAPGSASAQKALVNDLDLTVTTPSGEVIQAFGKSTKDNTNNMEQIDIKAPVSGVYKLEVKGANVPQGKNGTQPFAVVVSGVAN